VEAAPASFLREVLEELRRVVWPAGSQVARNSLVVLAVLVLVAVVIGVVDVALTKSTLALFR
jgi:preprotein translocase SecE subunit